MASNNHSLILHAGPHKTGSTALQAFLFRNRLRLKDNGLLYPESGLRQFGHHDLIKFLLGRPNDFSLPSFEQDLEFAGQIVLSSEDIMHLGPQELSRLKSLLRSREAKIVYYLRRLCDLWPSHWKEMIKHGESLSFPEYLAFACHAAESSHNPAVDQFLQLDRLRRAFGSDAIRIVGYDFLRLSGGHIATDFLDRFTVVGSFDGEGSAAEANPALPDWFIELLRMLNFQYLSQTGEVAPVGLRKALVKLHSKEADALSQLKDAIEECVSEVIVDSRCAAIAALQQRTIDAFGDAICDPAEEVVKAYCADAVSSTRVLKVSTTFPQNVVAEIGRLLSMLGSDLVSSQLQ